jgi:cellulose synthase operon protein C
VRLARAAAAVGAQEPSRSLADLDAIEKELADPTLAPALAFPYASPEASVRSYQSIATGLRANANHDLGRLEAAALALERGRTLSEQRFAESNREDDARALTLLESQLAANAAVRRDLPAAGRWIGMALDHADAAMARAGAAPNAVDADQLHVLRLATELQVLGRAKVSGNVRNRVESVQKGLIAVRDAAQASDRRWFEIYLALTAGDAQARPPKTGSPVSGK